MLILLLSGCGASKYEAVDLTIPGSMAETVTAESDSTVEIVETEEKPTIRLGAAVANEESVQEDLAKTTVESGEVKAEYLETDDYVIVTADLLNVRSEDNTTARIYVQLPAGEILHRTAYNDQWCRVEYDGGVAYVSTDMVKVAETSVPEYTKTGVVTEEPAVVSANGHVVAIDAGCQAKANAEKEPIGPASQTKKAKMPASAVGTATGVQEYELTLTVAKQLKKELRERGYEVVMIRESHDVNLSQAERSKIANKSGAEIFIRLSANSMENSSIYGAMAMCMTEHNPYNSELSSDSYRLSKQIINNICANTGTKNRGVQKVDNSSAINWCEIPVSVIKMGFLSNPDEDRWLQTEEYQDKIVAGISDAVDRYFAVGSEG
ncbi:MAG: N-acetylmuramoyl-L-alanine amidase [Lachnospiraceae bacterium]|nr:N-acetylmuramoyl-L-alanine amidase [Lachnospiraceae bacterium]